MHPCHQTDESLLADCKTIRQRRSGPGGQHRNKVETAIRLKHQPTGLSGQASEKRSQADNLKQALFRLRIELALQHRAEKNLALLSEKIERSEIWQKRKQGRKISINPAHADFPAMLADLLDCLAAANWDHKQTAQMLQLSTSQLIKFLKKEPPALAMLNEHRQKQGLNPLS